MEADALGIVMAGIDYSRAGVEQREPFSLTSGRVREVLTSIRGQSGVDGCVLIATCNRTELYLSCAEGIDLSPARILCGELAVPESCSALFTTRRERQALSHLMLLAAGLRSQIRGEDQVLAQVKTAIQAAREAHCADAVLETAFRLAVSVGKRVKTEVPLSPVESSTAHRAVEVLREQAGTLRGLRALVIGNGEMGRLSAALLAAQGCEVTMTLRSYKRGAAVIPAGCGTVPYDERYRVIPHCDIAVSATTSPHFTLQAAELRGCPALPRYFVDLAVPRDIEPEVAELAGIRCWNVDTLGGGPCGETAEKLRAIRDIANEYIARFDAWQSRRAVPVAAK